MARHPYTNDKPELVLTPVAGGLVAYAERKAKYRMGSSYTMREHIATIRRLGGTMVDAFTDVSPGEWYVLRGAFDDVRSFDTRDEAITYVRALLALESPD